MQLMELLHFSILVLLLEAGPFPPWTTIVPYLRADVRHHTPSDWNVVTVPQIGLNNRVRHKKEIVFE